MTLAVKRKVSPRAPTMSLDDAIDRVEKMYKQEGRHPAPLEVAMKHIGYSSKNGAALQAVASLGYWGLVERPGDGLLMVSKVVEDYMFTPLESHKRQLLISFLKKPPLFSSLLEKYQDRLPSDGSIKYDLIQRGFTPLTATTCLNVFKKSVEFSRYFEQDAEDRQSGDDIDGLADNVDDVGGEQLGRIPAQSADVGNKGAPVKSGPVVDQSSLSSPNSGEMEFDRIPVRLAGGRRAWLEIPMPFFEADKLRLKNHIDLLITDDEDDL